MSKVSKQYRKAVAKRDRRIKAHVCTSQETKVINRWGQGGYPTPGSTNRKK